MIGDRRRDYLLTTTTVATTYTDEGGKKLRPTIARILQMHSHAAGVAQAQPRKQRRILKYYCSLSSHFVLQIDNVEFFGRQ